MQGVGGGIIAPQVWVGPEMARFVGPISAQPNNNNNNNNNNKLKKQKKTQNNSRYTLKNISELEKNFCFGWISGFGRFIRFLVAMDWFNKASRVFSRCFG
jgi:hypothetical protein